MVQHTTAEGGGGGLLSHQLHYGIMGNNEKFKSAVCVCSVRDSHVARMRDNRNAYKVLVGETHR